MALNELTIKEARAKLDSGEITAVDLAKACLTQIKKADKEIHACLLVCEKEALAAAAAADKRIKEGERGDLLGIPYLCKDNIMVRGLRTTAASKILENYTAPYDATVIKKLKAAGAVLLGKTNLDEFAHGASTENSAYGPTRNPRDLSRVPGGSSGGSAAAVAANMCLFALGSDTGGSIRCPASFCGVVGLKPSYGRVSRFGLLSMTSSTDTIGCLTKTVYDAAEVMETISGRDDLDATSAPEAVEHYEQETATAENKKLTGLKIGLPEEYFLKSLNPDVAARIKEAAVRLENAGAKLIKVSLPYTEYGIPVYYIITPSEISSNLARFDGIGWGLAKNEAENLREFYKKNRGAGFGPETKRRIMLGTYVLSAGYYDAYYKKAQEVRELIKQDFAKAFEKVDLIFCPVSPVPAIKIGERTDDPLSMYLMDIYTVSVNLAGLPGLSMPAGKVGRLPVGLQIIGNHFQENKILSVASQLEKML